MLDFFLLLPYTTDAPTTQRKRHRQMPTTRTPFPLVVALVLATVLAVAVAVAVAARTLSRPPPSNPRAEEFVTSPLTDNTIQHATEIRNKCDADNKLYYPGITTCNDTVPYTVANHRRLETPSLITTQIDIKANGDLEVAATETGSRYTLQNLHSGKEGVDTRVKQVIQNVNLQRERIRQAQCQIDQSFPRLSS